MVKDTKEKCSHLLLKISVIIFKVTKEHKDSHYKAVISMWGFKGECVEINTMNTLCVEVGGERYVKKFLSHKLLLCLTFQRTYIKEIFFFFWNLNLPFCCQTIATDKQELRSDV